MTCHRDPKKYNLKMPSFWKKDCRERMEKMLDWCAEGGGSLEPIEP